MRASRTKNLLCASRTDIVLVAPVRIVYDSLARTLAREPDLTVRPVGRSGEALSLESASARRPVLLYDGSTSRAIHSLRGCMSSLGLDHVIVFGLWEAREDLRRCAELRVRGLVSRTAPLSELLAAIHTVAGDGHFQSASLAQDMTEVIAATTPAERLTDRERQIAELIACGYSNRIVGAELRLRPGTLKTHLRAIFRKYRVHTRGELASHVGYSSDVASTATAESSSVLRERSSNPAG